MAPAPRATMHQGGDAVGKRPQPRLLIDALTGEWRYGEAGEGRGSEPREPGVSAIRQEVRLGGPPTRTRWGVYHLARPGGPPWPKGVWYPQNQTSNLKPLPACCYLRGFLFLLQ